MARIAYKKEDVETMLRLINSLNIHGIENAKLVAVIGDKLMNDGTALEDTEEEAGNGSKDSL